MTRETFAKVAALVRAALGVKPEQLVADDSHFLDDFRADEMDVAQLILDVERAFRIELVEDISERCFTVGALCKAVDAALARSAQERAAS